ncbi:cystatin family protein [Nocardia sp. NPDC052566]|uniref:cystatin family protein n=1 Tax=Nocardia sp. NPDC052566 TaxID=3364330 RepID=UPI0037C5454C
MTRVDFRKSASRAVTGLLLGCVLMIVASAAAVAQPGGLSDADPNDPRVQDAARFAVDQLNGQPGSQYVLKAQKQVVQGMRYYLTVSLVVDDVRERCDVVVWVKPDNQDELVSSSCVPEAM